MNMPLMSATGSCDGNAKAQPQSHTGEIRKGDQGGLQVVIDNISPSKSVPRFGSICPRLGFCALLRLLLAWRLGCIIFPHQDSVLTLHAFSRNTYKHVYCIVYIPFSVLSPLLPVEAFK